MKPVTITITKYMCEICNAQYDTEAEAVLCESRPVTQRKGAKVGDTVRIIGGEGTGEKAVVTAVSVIPKDWGHYAWRRYWHTEGVTVVYCDSSLLSRFLPFDAYELI